MNAPAGSILPSVYFDGVSHLWGVCAYIASAITAAGLAFGAARGGRTPGDIIRLLLRVFMVAITIVFLREWLMRLNDVVNAFADYLAIDPAQVDDKYVKFIGGISQSNANASVWDIIWNTGSVGTALCYALLWMFGWLSWGVQYVVKLFGDILLSAGWSISPIFVAFFMLRPMANVALKYVVGLAALVCWPFGWMLASVVTNAMLDAAATASLMPVVAPGSPAIAPVLTVLLIGVWMIMSSIMTPYITTKVLLMGANPAAAFGAGLAGVGNSAVGGGFSAASAAVTGGASTAGIITAAALGAMSSSTESAARGGGSARTTSSVANGLSGLYGSSYGRRSAASSANMASSFSRFASATEKMAENTSMQNEFYREVGRRMNRDKNEKTVRPEKEDPTKAALEIMARVRKP